MNNEVQWNHQTYYHINIEDNDDDANNTTTSLAEDIENVMSIDDINGALLLPKMFEEGYQQKDCNTMYCIIQSRWM